MKPSFRLKSGNRIRSYVRTKATPQPLTDNPNESILTPALRVVGSVIPIRSRGVPNYSAPMPIVKSTVREILQKVIYTGQVPYFGDGRKHRRDTPIELFPGQHTALIDIETFQRVQEIRALVYQHPREKHGHETFFYPLTGLLRCGYCGANFRGVSAHGIRYYRDAAQIEHLGVCRQPQVRADKVEQAVAEWLFEKLKPIADVFDLECAQDCLNDAELRFDRARTLYLAGEMDRAVYDAEKIRLEDLKRV